jgi:hypothetical protein
MRSQWLGVVVLLIAGCAHEGKLRPQPGAVPLSEDGTAALTGAHGVRLVAHGSSWKGAPQNIERHFTLVEVRLENESGRPLRARFEDFELVGKDRFVALELDDLERLMSARASRYQPASDPYGTRFPHRNTIMSDQNSSKKDITYTSHNGTTPFTSAPCHTCPSVFEVQGIPSPDMRRLAFAEGPLEDGGSREGFLYFEEPLLLEKQVRLKVKLVDANTEEEFGTLSVPFEVH